MALTSNWRHQELAGEIFAQLRNQLVGKPCRPAIAPLDVRLPKGDEADERVDTVVQPDVLIVCHGESASTAAARAARRASCSKC